MAVIIVYVFQIACSFGKVCAINWPHYVFFLHFMIFILLEPLLF